MSEEIIQAALNRAAECVAVPIDDLTELGAIELKFELPLKEPLQRTFCFFVSMVDGFSTQPRALGRDLLICGVQVDVLGECAREFTEAYTLQSIYANRAEVIRERLDVLLHGFNRDCRRDHRRVRVVGPKADALFVAAGHVLDIRLVTTASYRHQRMVERMLDTQGALNVRIALLGAEIAIE